MSIGVASALTLFAGELPSGELMASDIWSTSDMKSESTVDACLNMLRDVVGCIEGRGKILRCGTGVGTRGGGSKSVPGADGRFAMGLCMCIDEAVAAVTRRSLVFVPNDDLPRQSACMTFARLRG